MQLIEEVKQRLRDHIQMLDADLKQCEVLEHYEHCAELKLIRKGLEMALEDVESI